MPQSVRGQKRLRKYYGKIREVLEMPNLIEVQKASYDLFLNSGEGDSPPTARGIQGVFQSVFPIEDFNGTARLEFVRYELEKPKYDVEECQARDMTYAAPLKVTLRLIVYEVDEITGAKTVKNFKDQEVYMGDMPLMTANGTFIVNGTERVIVSQMHRSPACSSTTTRARPTLGQAPLRLPDHPLPRLLARLRVRRQGPRLRAHRPRRKLPVTTLLYALGMDQEAIMNAYYRRWTSARAQDRQWVTKFFPRRVSGTRPDLRPDRRRHRRGDRQGGRQGHAAHGQEAPGRRAGDRAPGAVQDHRRAATSRRTSSTRDRRHLCRGRRRAHARDGPRRQVIGGTAKELLDAGFTTIPVLDIDNINVGPYIRNTMAGGQEPEPRDRAHGHLPRHAPGRAAHRRRGLALFDTLFFDKERYDLSPSGA
jgi:DNA-directed RNA polymerase subunit beta